MVIKLCMPFKFKQNYTKIHVSYLWKMKETRQSRCLCFWLSIHSDYKCKILPWKFVGVRYFCWENKTCSLHICHDLASAFADCHSIVSRSIKTVTIFFSKWATTLYCTILTWIVLNHWTKRNKQKDKVLQVCGSHYVHLF